MNDKNIQNLIEDGYQYTIVGDLVFGWIHIIPIEIYQAYYCADNSISKYSVVGHGLDYGDCTHLVEQIIPSCRVGLVALVGRSADNQSLDNKASRGFLLMDIMVEHRARLFHFFLRRCQDIDGVHVSNVYEMINNKDFEEVLPYIKANVAKLFRCSEVRTLSLFQESSEVPM